MNPVQSICFIVREDEALLNNKIFTDQPLYGMKSDNYPFVALKSAFTKMNIAFNTYDVVPPKDADMVICLDDLGTFKNLDVPSDKPSYLIISEPPIYNAETWDPSTHIPFKKVFTYDTDLIKSEKYVDYTFAIDFDSHKYFNSVTEEHYYRRSLCCLIAGAFQVVPPTKTDKSLLYERYLTADYFSNYHTAEFDVFGRDLINEKFEYFRGAAFLRKLKLGSLVKYLGRKKTENILKSFKGSIPPLEKLDYQNRYNFSICYDNSSINGCISERIFDCFASRTVPIYLGAPNVDVYIPKNCFIDRNNFQSYEELYNFMKQMDYSTYLNYLEAAEIFLKSDQVHKFTVQNYTTTIISHLSLEKSNTDI